MLAPLSRPGHKPTVTDPGSAVGQGTLNRAQAPHVDDPENAGRNQAGRFTKGCSGNGTGNPKGTRNKASLLLDKMASGEAGAVLGALLEKAKRGDVAAATTVLARLWPVQKGRSITLDLPRIVTAADVTIALETITMAIGSGEITPEEGAAVAGVLEQHRKAIETQALELRIARLEAQGRDGTT
jgi:hypothetical protein